MDTMLVIGIGVVAVGTGVGAFLMFGQRSNSLTEAAVTTGTIPAPSADPARQLSAPSARRRRDPALRPPVPRGLRSTDVHVRWYQRLRAGLVLLLITVGIGMAIGAVIGAAALAVSIVVG